MTATRAVSPLSRLGFGLCAVALAALAPQAAFAQGRLDAQYEATLAGIPVGKGTWTIEIGDDTFSATAQGGTAGLLKAFSGGTGSGASQGRVVNGALVPNAYTATTTTQKKVRNHPPGAGQWQGEGFFDRSGAAGRSGPGRRHRRAPQKRARSHDRLDAARARQWRAADARCLPHGAGIFDGRLRYDLKLDYKRMETVKAERGYHGPALVCAIYFTPVAGYIPDRPVIKYLAAERRIEIAFVPIAGTRVLVPFRMTIPTPFGPAMLEATSFVTTAHAAAGGEDELIGSVAPSLPSPLVGEGAIAEGKADEGFSPRMDSRREPLTRRRTAFAPPLPQGRGEEKRHHRHNQHESC